MADSISLNTHDIPFTDLSTFALKLHGNFLLLASDYPSPKPSMVTFKKHIDKLESDLVKWGGKGNRGKHSEHEELLDSSKAIRKDLMLLAAYAINEQPDNPVSWAALGFPLEKAREKNQVLEAVRDFHHFISRAVPLHHNKLKWKKPLNTKRNLVKGYVLQASTSAAYPIDPAGRMLMNVIAIVTETSFIDKKPFGGPNYYWVTPFNSQGLGVRSGLLKVVNASVETE